MRAARSRAIAGIYPAPRKARSRSMPTPAPAVDPMLERQAPGLEIDPRYLRQEVDYHGTEAPGTIVIDTPNKFLYLVEGGGKAMRYGIGVGRPGFTWSGVHAVSAKKEWPDWVPPEEMLQRQPDLPHFMAGGPNNPLGARAMYLGSTLYRIHGSNEPWTIGHNVSSGCIRMRNADVIDLYEPREGRHQGRRALSNRRRGSPARRRVRASRCGNSSELKKANSRSRWWVSGSSRFNSASTKPG